MNYIKEKYTSLFGQDLNEEEIKTQTISYLTLANSFQNIMCNNIINDEYFQEELTSELYSHYENITKEYTTEELFEECECHGIIDDDTTLADFKENEEENKRELIEEYARNYEAFQFYIVDDGARKWIEAFTDDLVVYNQTLELDIWCITHWGTSWSIVPTDRTIQEAFERV